MRYLGHVDNLLGNRRHTRDEELKNVGQLFHRLQHKNIEILDDFVPDASMSLQLPPRQRLKQCRSPLVGLPSCDESSKYSAGQNSVLVPSFCPRRASFAVRHLRVRMVGHRSQYRSHRLLLVSPPRAQTALPSPPRGPVIAMQRHVDHWGSNKGKRALRAITLESERLTRHSRWGQPRKHDLDTRHLLRVHRPTRRHSP